MKGKKTLFTSMVCVGLCFGYSLPFYLGGIIRFTVFVRILYTKKCDWHYCLIKNTLIYLFICLFICLFVYLFICLFIYLFIYLGAPASSEALSYGRSSLYIL